MMRRVQVLSAALLVSGLGLLGSLAPAQAQTLRQSASLLQCGPRSTATVMISYQFTRQTKMVTNTCLPDAPAVYPFQLPSSDYAALGVLESLSYAVTVSHVDSIASTVCAGTVSGSGVWGTINLHCQLNIHDNPNGGYGAYFYTTTTP